MVIYFINSKDKGILMPQSHIADQHTAREEEAKNI